MRPASGAARDCPCHLFPTIASWAKDLIRTWRCSWGETWTELYNHGIFLRGLTPTTMVKYVQKDQMFTALLGFFWESVPLLGEKEKKTAAWSVRSPVSVGYSGCCLNPYNMAVCVCGGGGNTRKLDGESPVTQLRLLMVGQSVSFRQAHHNYPIGQS